MNVNDPYTSYYLNQAGSGIGQVYSGSPYQRGSGIGSILSGIFRSFSPLFKSGAKAVGGELLRAGSQVLHDISMDKPPKSSLRKRASEAGQTLVTKLQNKINKMSGNGDYKRSKLNKKSQSQSSSGKRKKRGKSSKRLVRSKNIKFQDIFPQ